MYRASIARQSARAFKQISVDANKSILEMGGEMLLAFFQQSGIMSQAERMNRRRDRTISRYNRHYSYGCVGLNGHRAMDRRRRQIAAGSLRAENGLVE